MPRRAPTWTSTLVPGACPVIAAWMALALLAVSVVGSFFAGEAAGVGRRIDRLSERLDRLVGVTESDDNGSRGHRG